VIAPPPRDRHTRELIRRFEERRRRRRRLRLLLAGLGGAVLAALLVTLVVLIVHGGGTRLLADSSSGPSTEATSATGTSLDPAAPDYGTTPGEDPGTSVTSLASPTTAIPPPTTVPPTTTSKSTTTTAPPTTSSTTERSSGLVVVIDPGHQAKADSSLEPIGPGSSELKAKVSSGTASVNTGTPESELVLAVALKLRESLTAHGITVVMTRTTQDVNISNVQRAQLANDAAADLFVRVHADGNADSAVHGIHVLYPASIAGWTDDIAVESKRAATLAQNALIAATGAKDRGIDARSDMTGFNWCDVPVILPEIGFMTNPAEDKLLATGAYQDKIVEALTQAILAYLGVS
jgi:N-acetylmuramoyl-L-alanine amidase